MMLSSAVRTLCLLPLLTGALGASASPAGRVEIPVQSGGAFSVPVYSIKEQRFQKTLHQQYDFSCGSAALATLLTHHYNFPVNEQEVFREMFARGDQAKIKKEGFSLLDIKNYLASHGFDADGYVAELDKLSVAKVPAIVLVKEQGYYHFVVVKGLRDGRVLIGDPSSGTRAISRNKFTEIWANNILFVIKNKPEMAQFNTDRDWQVAPGSPIAAGHHRSFADYGLAKRGPADF
jgi:predicted double-glycine peptidase